MKKLNKCRCELCRLSCVMQQIEKKCTPKERKALNDLWGRMEWAETLLDWQRAGHAIKK